MNEISLKTSMHIFSRLPLKSWLGDTGTRFLLLFTVLYAVYTLLSVYHWAGVPDILFVTDLASMCFSVTATIFIWRTSGSLKLPQRIRRGWRFLACGYLAYFLGDATWFYYEIILKIQPYPSLADVPYLAYYP
ncbi:MAG: hypothetical protein ACRESK_09110, partial [Gammaproteobacteria bacterium]